MGILLVVDGTALQGGDVTSRILDVLATFGDVELRACDEVGDDTVRSASLLVVGATTGSVDGPPEGETIRTWSRALPPLPHVPAAAFGVADLRAMAVRRADGANRQLLLHDLLIVAPPGAFVAGDAGTPVAPDDERVTHWATAVGLAGAARRSDLVPRR